MEKPELRRSLRKQRHTLAHGLAKEAAEKIMSGLTVLIPWPDIHSLHIYMPCKQEQEVDIARLLNYIWQAYPSVQIAVPRLEPGDSFESVKVTPTTKWQTSTLGIPEPIGGKVLPRDYLFDVIIVPTLGFDHQGYRLGYGKGMYDRFLATQTSAMTIGLSYEMGYVADLPREPHDVPLDYIVTEQRTVKRSEA